MFGKTKIWIAVASTLLIFVLAGCTGAEPSLEPTIDTQPTFALIQTQAAQTVVAEMTLNAPTPTETPAATETPAPTNTPEATPTEAATPTPEPTATNTFIPWTATPTATTPPLACSIEEQSPAFGADLKPGADFDGRWVIKNTGTETWQADTLDFKFISGEKFHTGGADLLDLERDVVIQGTYTFVLDMLAPNNDGRYTTNWALVRGGETICALSLTIDVVP